jgi:hypothetical protein
MNYYKQFAEMLGLELGQEFNLTDADGKKINYASYKITENGLCFKGTTNGAWHSESSIFLKNLLSGDYKAVPKPWKLEVGEQYFYYSVSLNRATTRKWCKGNYDLLLWKFGNCFKTEKEANEKGKEVMEAIHKEYEEA